MEAFKNINGINNNKNNKASWEKGIPPKDTTR